MADAAAVAHPVPVPTPRQQVPREFVGLARNLINIARLQDIEVNSYLEQTLWPQISTRFRHHKVLRETHVRDIEKQWRILNSVFVLSSDIKRTKKSIAITEIRITASQYHFDGWSRPDSELGVSVTRIELTTFPVAKVIVTPIAQLSLHCLARRMQRCNDIRARSCSAIVADIRPLVGPVEAGTTVIRCGSGEWHGQKVRCRTEHGRFADVWLARTFIELDSL